jgi:PucR family transcriptional regulator, purine catabolism regulatory protein
MGVSAERLLAELALAGRLTEPELRAWLAPLGIGERVAALVFSVHNPDSGLPVLQRSMDALGAPSLASIHDGLLCSVVGCGSLPIQGSAQEAQSVGASRVAVGGLDDLLDLAARVRAELGEQLGEVRAGAGRPGPATAISRSFREARSALQATSARNGRAPEVASYEDLGAVGLLFSLQSEQALHSYCEVVLGPLEAEGGRYGEELLRSADTFIEHNGHWEHAAQALYCHRHTLRYRICRVEQLTKRDLSSARDRIELWLALRGRELTR